jgi:hypothetical protein
MHGVEAEQVFTRLPIRCSIVCEFEQLKNKITMRMDRVFIMGSAPTVELTRRRDFIQASPNQ